MSSNDCLQREIPIPVKREVRKRCGFGCIICGNFLIEYHHFRPEFSKATKHDPNGITLLCPTHHAGCSRGQIDSTSIAEYDADPYLSHYNEQPKHDFSGFQYPLEVAFGSIIFFSDDGTLLEIDNKPIIKITKGKGNIHEPPLLSVNFSSPDGTRIVIEENHLVEVSGWDVDYKGNVITLRKKHRSIALKLEMQAPHRIIVERADLQVGGNRVRVQLEKHIFLEAASGAKIDFPVGEIVVGGKVSLSSEKGIQITGGSRVLGLEKGMKLNIDLDSLFEESRKLRKRSQ